MQLKHVEQKATQMYLYADDKTIIIIVHFLAFLNSEIKINDELDDKKIKALKELDSYYVLKDLAIKKLVKKEYSTYILTKELLKSAPASENIIAKLIADLVSLEYLDDYYQAQKIVEKAILSQKSPAHIYQLLNKYHLDAQLVSKQINQYDERESIEDIVSKLMTKNLKSKPYKVAIQSVYFKLISEGYSEDNINYVLDKLKLNDYEHDLSFIGKDYDKYYRMYQKKYEGKELQRKIIEALLRKGYNYGVIKKFLSEV